MPAANALEEVAGQDLHVASKDDQVAVTHEQLQQLRLRRELGVGGDRHVMERQAEGLDVGAHRLVV
jgi:hypothetical protein